MIRVLLRPKGKLASSEDDLVDENVVIFPENFTTKELNDYLNNFLFGNNSSKKHYSFFYQNFKIARQSLEVLLLEFKVSKEDLMIIEYKPAESVDLISADTFPDWIRCIKVEKREFNTRYYSGGFDGALRLGQDSILHEFKRPIIDLQVKGLFAGKYYVVACTCNDILLLYPDGTRKLKVIEQSNLTCIEVKQIGADGVIYLYTGHEDGTLLTWRISKSKGFQIQKTLKFSSPISGIQVFSCNDYFFITDNSVYRNDQLLIKCSKVITAFDIKKSTENEYLIAIGHPDGAIKLFQNSLFLRQLKIDSEVKWISGVRFFSTDFRLAIVGHDGIIRIFNHHNGSLLHKIDVCPPKKLLALDVCGDFVWVGGEECIVKTFQIEL
jgi:WD40 repeat protein